MPTPLTPSSTAMCNNVQGNEFKRCSLQIHYGKNVSIPTLTRLQRRSTGGSMRNRTVAGVRPTGGGAPVAWRQQRLDRVVDEPREHVVL